MRIKMYSINNYLQEKIVKPTLIIDETKINKNIARMADKAKKSGAKFRPHFKTHQSAEIGSIYKKYNVDTITVSSVDMAEYFAKNGWQDITIAFPVNILEIEKINDLASKIQLNLLTESVEVISLLETHLTSNVNIWIKIDVGYHRTGVYYNDVEDVLELIESIKNSHQLHFKGLLTHAGNTYHAKSPADIISIYHNKIKRLHSLKRGIVCEGFDEPELSIGDTPSCSLIEDFSDVDEIRPGNFIYYDVMQFNIGVCSISDIAVAIGCPVVSKHRQRNEIVIYGGAVHLSKEFILNEQDKKIYGYIGIPGKKGWHKHIENSYVSALSQEHGIIKADTDFYNEVKI